MVEEEEEEEGGAGTGTRCWVVQLVLEITWMAAIVF